MDYAIEHLKRERERLLLAIKMGQHDKVRQKIEMDQAILWLEKIRHYNFPEAKKCSFIELPDANMQFFSYRIMNDCESEDRDDWIELEDQKLIDKSYYLGGC